MASKKCKSCGNIVGNRAKQCPNCGQPQTTGIAKFGLYFTIFIVVTAPFVLLNDDDTPAPKPAQQKASQQAPKPESYTPPDWTHIESVAQAEYECPANNNTCMLHGVIAEWGKQCKQWIRLETDKPFTAKGNGDIYELFNTRLEEDDQGQYILRGIEMIGWLDGMEFRYEYGCRIDQERGVITGIAPPEPLYTQNGLRFKDFN